MSTDPINDAYSSLMREAGYSSAEFAGQIENAERLILEIPGNADSAAEMLFFQKNRKNYSLELTGKMLHYREVRRLDNRRGPKIILKV